MASLVHFSDLKLSFGVSSVGGHAVQTHSLGIVSLHTMTVEVHVTETALRVGFSVLGRAPEPANGLGVILVQTKAKVVQGTEVELGFGQALIRRIAGKSDVLVENFKLGNLARYKLGYDDLKESNPGLVRGRDLFYH